MNHLLRRVGFYALAATFAAAVNFLLPRLMPGDAAGALMARFQGRLSPEALGALQAAFGLDDGPIWRAALRYLQRLVHGDLGLSTSQFPTPVFQLVAGGLGWTLLVAGGGLIMSFVLGTWLGVQAAWNRGGRLDRWLPPLLALVGAFPYFWLAMAALYLLGFELRWFPLRHASSGLVPPGWTPAFLSDVVRHAALPTLTVVLASVGGWMVGMRNAMVAVLGSEYISLGRAKGLSDRRLMWGYAARNALLPQLAGLGMSLGFVVGGALLTEVVFAYPGLGFLMVQAVRSQDLPLMQGLFLMVTLAVLGANLLVDLFAVLLDPRVRGGEGRA